MLTELEELKVMYDMGEITEKDYQKALATYTDEPRNYD